VKKALALRHNKGNWQYYAHRFVQLYIYRGAVVKG